MIHLTLNTGHTFNVLPGKVTPAAIRMLGPMVVKGGDLIPHFAPWRTVITRGKGSAIFDIRRNRNDLVVLNAVAWTADGAAEAWPDLERHYMAVAEELAKQGIALDLEMPEMPASLPWLATWILPTAAIAANPQELHWMADFEQCLAATLIHKAQS